MVYLCAFSGPAFGPCDAGLTTGSTDTIALTERPPEGPDTSAEGLWRAALGIMQMQVDAAAYSTWLAGTSAMSLSGGVLTVAAPTAFVAEMLERRLFELVLDSVQRIAGGSTEVRIEVAGFGGDGHGADEGPGTEGRSDQSAGRGEQTQLVGAYTFESFVVGASNELAHAAASAVADRPGQVYNPLMIYSDVGLGKTHLMTAVGHRARARGLAVIYVTTEEFTNQYIGAIRAGETERFRARYRGADLLLLDDIQFLVGKEQTQEGFFHTFNALHMSGRQVVVTCDRPSSELGTLQERVRSRLAGGLSVDMQAPGLETRLAILQAKAGASALAARISDEALAMLAEIEHRSVREMEGWLNRALAYADLTGADVTVEAVRRAVPESLARPRPERPSPGAILDEVAARFAVGRDDLCGRRRDARITLARHVAMYLLREDAGLALAEVGRALGGRDHSTVLNARRRIASLLGGGDSVAGDIAAVRRALAGA